MVRTTKPRKPPIPRRLFFREHRLARGLTQEQVAERMNITKGMVSKLESGSNQPRADRIFAYAEAIDANPEALFRPPAEPSLDDMVRKIPAEFRNDIINLVAKLSTRAAD